MWLMMQIPANPARHRAYAHAYTRSRQWTRRVAPIQECKVEARPARKSSCRVSLDPTLSKEKKAGKDQT
jgi:hypothetical protein